MHAIVIEHVNVDELPEPWRTRLHVAGNTRVTVRIEEENTVNDNPLFGMWSNRTDMEDVESYLNKIRAPRLQRMSI